ncbi:cyclic lactone autoinducer peptide [Anaeromicropila populeti]|uniref:Cyclic lactone autoinducer peptide n=1 Tax=Anaeromicropila populeti TaxID=37658 RepID=A0A1I6JPR5_9FIRM|nr:cyclic lactone autoinducer peptide [Anaeromicropila populeti]SFR80944.1 cyclic lactone autoinducer peptide [Anaeromicropila populeti]
MKKTNLKAAKLTAEFLIKRNVNSACWFLWHQPKVPDGYKKFVKQKKL